MLLNFNLNRIAGWAQSKKILHAHIVLLLDVITSLCASAMALFIVGILSPVIEFEPSWIFGWLCGSLAISALIMSVEGMYRSIIRYSTLRELARLCIVCFEKDILLWVVMAVFFSKGIDSRFLTGIVIVDFFSSVVFLCAIRVIMILVYDFARAQISRSSDIRRVLVYGASDKSASVISRLSNSTHYKVVGSIRHGNQHKTHRLMGKDVYYFNNVSDLQQIAERLNISGIIFPYVSDARAEHDRLIAFCGNINLKTFIVPSIDEMSDGGFDRYIRKICIEDLLGRNEIRISIDEIVENFKDKIVMVTGAAGSIGSELCRQLATLGVRQLILFDNAETPLHNIRLELEDKFPELNFVAVIGDVRSNPRLDFVFRKHQPQIVFHAAAYKHVPLMEENPCEAVRVNVTGSRYVADKCVEYNVEKMVMVSTDKAVNPTNIMGCTKRLAEIYVQSLGIAIERGTIKGSTKFVTTRFGNVLGSNGSVIPRFREQIEHGGPITVTHPDITRFFMTIPEACRLVMEAATFATGTQIFVFDMGEPVRIVTLAERMISLAGFEKDTDIKIVFTGLRPGEKLYEEVLATKENTIPTTHDRIFVATVRDYPYDEAARVTDELTELATIVDIPRMVKLMKQIVPEFRSNNSEYEQYDINR